MSDVPLMASIAPKNPANTLKAAKDREERRQREAAAIARQRQLWGALNSFIRERNGFLVSAPSSLELRVDVLPGSTLVTDLTERGFQLRFCGTNMRTVPNGFVETHCYAFKLV